jgi:ribosomal-protein-alanine N-acetyltransferase
VDSRLNPGAHAIVATERLYLRDYRAEDRFAVHRYASDPEVVRWLPWGPNDLDDTERFLADARAAAVARPRLVYHLAVMRSHDDFLLGGVTLAVDAERGDRAELGYCLAPDAQGRGYAREAVAALLAFGRDELGVRRFLARIDSDNRASVALAEHLGLAAVARSRADAGLFGEGRTLVHYLLITPPGSDPGRRRGSGPG